MKEGIEALIVGLFEGLRDPQILETMTIFIGPSHWRKEMTRYRSRAVWWMRGNKGRQILNFICFVSYFVLISGRELVNRGGRVADVWKYFNGGFVFGLSRSIIIICLFFLSLTSCYIFTIKNRKVILSFYDSY